MQKQKLSPVVTLEKFGLVNQLRRERRQIILTVWECKNQTSNLMCGKEENTFLNISE